MIKVKVSYISKKLQAHTGHEIKVPNIRAAKAFLKKNMAFGTGTIYSNGQTIYYKPKPKTTSNT